MALNKKEKKKSPESTGRKQSGRFKPGQSGNPGGRPKGARHKSTMAALALLEGESQALTRKAIDEALNGNMAALRLCFERLLPAAKDRPVNVTFPEVKEPADLARLTAAILSAVGQGDIDSGQAASLAKVVDAHRNALELAEIESRLKNIEEKINEK